MTRWIRANPLLAFFVLAYALTWPLAALVAISLSFGLLGLFGPAAAAIIVAWVCEGRAGVTGLLAKVRLWRVAPAWYAIAVLVPIAVSGVVASTAVSLGWATSIHWTPFTPLTLVLFVLVVGEEIGWRGFALPRMIARFGVGRASLFLGLLWGFWHFPTFFLAGASQSEVPIAVYIAFTTALSGAFTWLWVNTQGSVLLATLLHGAVNAFGFTAEGLAAPQRMWLTAGAWAVCSLVLLALGQERRDPVPAPVR